MIEADPLAAVASRAAAGDTAALDELCRELQDLIYRLAMRLFAHPEDAADATQEALIRIVINVGSFEGRSKLTTWAYTVASRHFLRMKTQRPEPTVAGPEEFGDWIDQHRSEPSAEVASLVEFDELCGEVRIACTYGMLLCLTRPLRLAYLLGDVIGLTDIEGARPVRRRRQRFASAWLVPGERCVRSWRDDADSSTRRTRAAAPRWSTRASRQESSIRIGRCRPITAVSPHRSSTGSCLRQQPNSTSSKRSPRCTAPTQNGRGQSGSCRRSHPRSRHCFADDDPTSRGCMRRDAHRRLCVGGSRVALRSCSGLRC